MRGIPSKGVRSLGNSVLSQDHRPRSHKSSGKDSSLGSQDTTVEQIPQALGMLSRTSFGTREGDRFTSCVGPKRLLSISPARERNMSSTPFSMFSSKNLPLLPGMRLRGWFRDPMSTQLSGL